jgi:putative hemolysin
VAVTDREGTEGGTLVYPVRAESIPADRFREERYELAFARSPQELDAILELRFEVFNLELGEGLEASYATGRDEDPFDAVCHHLVVRDHSGERPVVVGSYRIQTSEMAAEHLGFYSAGEFDLDAIPADVIEQAVEVGRACVARSHRNTQVLFLLWRGLASYMAHTGKRYLFGCSSLTSQDPRDGAAMLRYLEAGGYLHPEIWVPPLPACACPPVHPEPEPATRRDVPPLFRIYLRHGARIGGPPAIDREFKTIDFLTLFDVDAMPERMRRLFFDP